MPKNRIYKLMRRSPMDFVMNICIIFLCLLSIFPFYWLFTGSVKQASDVMKTPPDWIPHDITLGNYADIFLGTEVWFWIFNSIASSVAATLGILVVSALTGYALSKIKFPGSRILFIIVIIGMVMPKEVYLLPLYQMMVDFDWRGTLAALIVPELAMPFGVFLMKQHNDGIPNEIMESTVIDGCNRWMFFYKFSIPLTKPGIGALAILAFIRVWNSYLWQYVMATGKTTYTLSVGMARMMVEPDIINYGLKFAGAAVAAIPLLMIFMVFQRYFISGITSGAVKG